MVYGDESINLHAYTYKPHSTAIAQAGNLYFYAINNPVAYQDASGEDAAVLALIAESGLDGLSLAGLGEFGPVGLGVLWVKSQIDITILRLTITNYASTQSTTTEEVKSAKIYSANKKKPVPPSKLKKGKQGKVKTPETDLSEWTKNRDGSYTHRDTGWTAKKDPSRHAGEHWDMYPPRGSGHINVGLDGTVFGGSTK